MGFPVGAYTAEAATYGNVVDGMRAMEEDDLRTDRRHSRRAEMQNIPNRERTVIDQAVATGEAFVPAYFHENQAKVEIKSKKSRRKYSTKAQRRVRQSTAEEVERKTEETSIHPVTGQFKQQEVVTSSKQESSVESRHTPEESSRMASEPRGGKGGGTRQAQTVTQKLEAMTADHNTKHAISSQNRVRIG